MIDAGQIMTGTRFRSIPEALGHWSRSEPESPALSAGPEELGYGDLARLVEEAAERMHGGGLGAGDRLALLGRNSIEWTVAFLAGLRLGAIVVPLNTRLSPLEIGRQLEIIEPRMLLIGETLAASLAGFSASATTAVLILERDHRNPTLWTLPRAGITEHSPASDAPAVIAFTSGTTGSPRGAVLHHQALVRSAAAYIPYLETTSSDRTTVLVPLFHNTGFVDQLSQMLLVGGQVALLDEFNVAGALDALARRPPTYLIAVPSIFRLLMLSDRVDAAFRDLRVAVYGGASMPTPWIDELAARWPQLRLFNSYGLTEFTSVTHLLSPSDPPARRDTVGRPVNAVGQMVADERGRELAPGEQGEVWVKGPMRMLGYWRDDVATRDVFRGEWLRTGDLGSVDTDDFLTVAGRAADVINRGGEKIHSVQVEAALSELPAVAEAAVVGAPHPILGERVLAAVVPRAGREVDPDALRAHLRARVADYAVPEEFLLIGDLPRNAAGKPDRRRIREEVLAMIGRSST